jgi:hypothetical protein
MQLFFQFLQIISGKENSSWNSLPSRPILKLSRRREATEHGSRDPRMNIGNPTRKSGYDINHAR